MKPYYLEVIKRPKGFVWRVVCRRNGKKVAIGGELYASKQSAERAFKKHGKTWVNMDFVDLKK